MTDTAADTTDWFSHAALHSRMRAVQAALAEARAGAAHDIALGFRHTPEVVAWRRLVMDAMALDRLHGPECPEPTVH
jgi:hypothetical protein